MEDFTKIFVSDWKGDNETGQETAEITTTVQISFDEEYNRLAQILGTLYGILNILYYATIPICIIVIIGNVFILIVMNHPQFKKVSTSFYICVLCFTDILTLIRIIRYFLVIFGVNFASQILKFMRYTMSMISLFSPWIIVLISFDRFLSVVSIKWAMRNKTRKVQIFMLLGVLIALTSINLPIFFIDYTTYVSYINVYPYIEIVLCSLVPFILMCIFNLITFFRLRTSKRKFNSKNADGSRENRFLSLSIALNVLFIISDLPQSITKLWGIDKFNVNYSREGYPAPNHPIEYLRFGIPVYAEALAVYWKMIQPLSQFFVYIAFNPLFRQKFKEIILKKCSRHEN